MAQKPVKPIIAQPVKTTAPQQKASNHTPAQFVFDKGNYRLLFIAIAVIFIGFALMSGTTDIYETRKIVIAPLVVLAGFAIGFLAIFKKPEAK
jgi:hypothetical protein